MENQTSVFSFKSHEVRTMDQEGEVWFVAADVCTALDLANSRQVVSRLDDDEKGVLTMDTLGGPQETVIVSESGVYSLILTSRKKEAKVFKRWITHEVLPTIRKTGTYTLTINPAQQSALHELVRNVVERSGGSYPGIWSRFNNHFRLSSYKQLPVTRFDEACAYLKQLQPKPAIEPPQTITVDAMPGYVLVRADLAQKVGQHLLEAAVQAGLANKLLHGAAQQ